jgi:hypothetical protein
MKPIAWILGIAFAVFVSAVVASIVGSSRAERTKEDG